MLFRSSIVPDAGHGIGDPEVFADFVGELFRTRRKQIGATLSRMGIATPDDLDGTRRPESMSPEELLELHRSLGSPAVRGDGAG